MTIGQVRYCSFDESLRPKIFIRLKRSYGVRKFPMLSKVFSSAQPDC